MINTVASMYIMDGKNVLNKDAYIVVTSKYYRRSLKAQSFILCIFFLVILGCRKEHLPPNCGCDQPATQFIKVFGIGIATADGMEIVSDEAGILLPCSRFVQHIIPDSQPLIVSGLIKPPCKTIPYQFTITPIEISAIKFLNTGYDKTDITFQIIKSEDYGYPAGFGYFVEDTRPSSRIKILQPILPAVSGLNPYKSKAEATKSAMLVIYLLRKYPGSLPSQTVDILKYVKIIP